VGHAPAIHVVKDSEEGRAFLQRRLALSSTLLAGASGAFWLTLVMLNWTSRRSLGHVFWSIGSASHFSQVLVLVLARLLLIRERSVLVLRAVDATAVLASVLAFAAMLVFAHERTSWDTAQQVNVMPGVTASILIFVGRAILIPSTALRTAVIGVVTTVIIASATAMVFLYSANPLVSRNWLLGAVYSSLWCITAGVLGVVSSAVIYRLQARARVADELGQYHLEEKIGEGGMGVVYRARHAMLRRPTAVKLLPSDRAGESAVARFEKEVQLTSQLTHPNTIAIYDYGRTPEGVFYYAMEYVDGFDLECLVQLTGPLPASRVVHVLAQACDALDEAHSMGLIHRDIKPANILLCERGRSSDVVKVVDFGLVKELEAGDSSSSTENAVVGTPLYLAPEAILEPASIDARSDLYSLGCVAYYLLTGSPPFPGTNTLAVFAGHLQQDAEPPSTRAPVPRALEELVMRCLAKSPNERPPTSAALARLLRALPIEPWSEEHARAWWGQHGDRLRVHRTAVSASGKTLAIDLSERV